ncbi:hypothetical protein [Moritella viscosa]|uniref:Exopolyphosphatase-related protein n=1 Tax=Moritella viscosa TaxID=80854 RepID=A0A1K9ZI03_9GAMM|nr:hypothetical protein [Moritella viscosa]SGY94985.1 Exopolyphosphatase-related protein [Moritella viscosa]
MQNKTISSEEKRALDMMLITMSLALILCIVGLFYTSVRIIDESNSEQFLKDEEVVLRKIVSTRLVKQFNHDYKKEKLYDTNTPIHYLYLTSEFSYEINFYTTFSDFFPEVDSMFDNYMYRTPRKILYQVIKSRVKNLENINMEELAYKYSFGGDNEKLLDKINFVIDRYKYHIENYESLNETTNNNKEENND